MVIALPKTRRDNFLLFLSLSTLSLCLMLTGCAQPELNFTPRTQAGNEEPTPRNPRFCVDMRQRALQPLSVFQIDQTLEEVFDLAENSETRQMLSLALVEQILSRPFGLRYEATKINLFAKACQETNRAELKSGNLASLEEIFLCEDLSESDRTSVSTLAMTLAQSNIERAEILCTILATTPEAITEIL
jgi:uncharacterized lipoprotein YajG